MMKLNLFVLFLFLGLEIKASGQDRSQQLQQELERVQQVVASKKKLVQQENDTYQQSQNTVYLWQQIQESQANITRLDEQAVLIKTKNVYLQYLLKTHDVLQQELTDQKVLRTSLRSICKYLSEPGPNIATDALVAQVVAIDRDLRWCARYSVLPAWFHRREINQFGRKLSDAIAAELIFLNNDSSAQMVSPSAPPLTQVCINSGLGQQAAVAYPVNALNQGVVGGHVGSKPRKG